MEKPEMQAGDVFLVDSAGPMSVAIKAIEKFNSKDDRAEFGHAGIIIDSLGTTFEALATIRHASIDRYRGRLVMIMRPTLTISNNIITLNAKQEAISKLIRDHKGQIYPAWRLIFHLIPPLAKYMSFGNWLVCSELTAKYLNLSRARSGPYSGINPDDLADKWRDSRRFKKVFEGVFQ